MGLGMDIIIFITALLFGIFLFWRESNSNSVYRFFNKILNSKELQMSADNPKGFVYKQAFIPRLLFIVASFLLIGLIVQFLTPIAVFSSYFMLSGFATFATGTIIGTYLANFVIKTTSIVEEKSESLSEIVEETVEKGKDFIENLKSNEAIDKQEPPKEIEIKPETKKQSARDRLKDKGLM